MTSKVQALVSRPRLKLSLMPITKVLPRRNRLSEGVTPLPVPGRLEKLHPLNKAALQQIAENQRQIIDILEGRDSRMIAIVGPCSEDDSIQPDGTPSVVRYAKEIQQFSRNEQISKNLLVVMRCNPAKPRSDLGLAGLEQKDVVTAHKLLVDIANLGVPLAMEVMSPEHIARYGKLCSLPWVGARNNKDTLLRHALSAHPEYPILIKNDEYGELKSGIQAINTINEPHDNARITLADGRTGYVSRTRGNLHTALVWRGGSHYMSPEAFEEGLEKTIQAGLPYAVDCSHGNTQAHDVDHAKSVKGQKACFEHLLNLLKNDKLDAKPKAVMLESYLLAGCDTSRETPGKSWTDPCVSLKDTKTMLRQLASVAR